MLSYTVVFIIYQIELLNVGFIFLAIVMIRSWYVVDILLYRFDAVIHFAGLKAVGESVAHPFRYFSNNSAESITLYETMAKYNCKKVSLF